MATGTDLRYAELEDLYLDPMNPRLGRNNTGREVTQEQVLGLMKDWTLDELAVSFLESGGFWTHEALLVTKEKLYGKERLVVIEGNRRLATLKYLKRVADGESAPKGFADIVEEMSLPKKLFDQIPYILVGLRKEIEAFLGFRHVTGIKEWRPAEKAEFIVRLIDERGLSYEQVMRKIGSKARTVRQNYISYRLLLQMENSVDIPQGQLKERFSVMYLSLRTQGVQTYLDIDIQADPKTAKKPVPRRKLQELVNFALWMFGDGDKHLPLFSDSRQVDSFGKILESKKAIEYLERTENPSFEVALRTAGGDEPEILKLIDRAADNIELALTRVHLFKKSKKLQKAVGRLGADAKQLVKIFPTIKTELEQD